MNCVLCCYLSLSDPPVSSVTRPLHESNECWPAVPSGPDLPTLSLRALWFICSLHADVYVTGYANVPNNMLIRANEYSLAYWTTFRMTVGSWDAVSLEEKVRLNFATALSKLPVRLTHHMASRLILRSLVWIPDWNVLTAATTIASDLLIWHHSRGNVHEWKAFYSQYFYVTQRYDTYFPPQSVMYNLMLPWNMSSSSSYSDRQATKLKRTLTLT